jgi:hypothetical protein
MISATTRAGRRNHDRKAAHAQRPRSHPRIAVPDRHADRGAATPLGGLAARGGAAALHHLRRAGSRRRRQCPVLHTQPPRRRKDQFIDGWTGKGSVARELAATLHKRDRSHAPAPSESLAVLVDPGDCAAISGTAEDFLVPNACLNATVSGLVSRTVVTPDLVGPDDFHGRSTTPTWVIATCPFDSWTRSAENFPLSATKWRLTASSGRSVGARPRSSGNVMHDPWLPSTASTTSTSSKRVSAKPYGCCCTESPSA